MHIIGAFCNGPRRPCESASVGGNDLFESFNKAAPGKPTADVVSRVATLVSVPLRLRHFFVFILERFDTPGLYWRYCLSLQEPL